MTKLTDTQLIILSQAGAREDGCGLLPEGMRPHAALKVGTSLSKRKLMREVRTKSGMPVWRKGEGDRALSLVLTAAGRKVITARDEESAAAIGNNEQRAAAIAASSIPKVVSGERRLPRENSKQALVVKMLSGKAGTTIDALVDATGWLPHTTRAALTGLRRRGLAILREPREGKASIYRIEVGAAA